MIYELSNNESRFDVLKNGRVCVCVCPWQLLT